jgi:hypothetical protein
MNQELNRFFNRIQNRNFSFTTDKFDEEYLTKLEKELQKEINKNLLKRPVTTCNWLKSIYNQIVEGQEYIHKTYIINIQDRIDDKLTKTIITKEEDENFEGASIILHALDSFKSLIIQNIKLVKPEIIKPKNTKVENIPVVTIPEGAAAKTEAIQNIDIAKYLKKNGTQYYQFHVAIYAHYKKIKLHDPQSDDNGVLRKLALKFDFKSDTSANQIFNKFYNQILKSLEEEKEPKKIFQAISLKTKVSCKTIMKYIEEIVPLLNLEEQNEAKKDINTLKLLIN